MLTPRGYKVVKSHHLAMTRKAHRGSFETRRDNNMAYTRYKTLPVREARKKMSKPLEKYGIFNYASAVRIVAACMYLRNKAPRLPIASMVDPEIN